MKRILFVATFSALVLMAGMAFAHSPIFDCFDNGDNTVTCEGGFSDGSSASGVNMLVNNTAGDLLLEGKMDQNSMYTFDKPKEDYSITFDAGEGHKITVEGKNILE